MKVKHTWVVGVVIAALATVSSPAAPAAAQTVPPPDGGIAGKVFFDDGGPSGQGAPIAGAQVELCPAENPRPGTCRQVRSGPDGGYLFNGLATGAYDVTSWSPAGTLALATVTLDDVRLVNTNTTLSGQDIRLYRPVPVPAGTEVISFCGPRARCIPPECQLRPCSPPDICTRIQCPPPLWCEFFGTCDGELVTAYEIKSKGIEAFDVATARPFAVTTKGCVGGTATFTLLLGDTPVATVDGVQDNPPGTYTALFRPILRTGSGPRVLRAEVIIRCPAGTGGFPYFQFKRFDVLPYRDPSGTVVTTTGEAIPDATVTLLHADSAAGPFTPVEDGDDRMSPANRSNPSKTDAGGAFGWEVLAGFYKVSAQAPGCVDPADAAKDFVESAVLEIPPAVTGLRLELNCTRAPASAPGETSGSVPATLALTLGLPATFGAFAAGVAREYTAATTATVTSTAGAATLAVADPSPVAPGRLVNGTFALASPLQARASSTASFGPVGPGAHPLALRTWAAPVANDHVTLELRQSIGAAEALRTGAYSKTLTYTLSTTSP